MRCDDVISCSRVSHDLADRVGGAIAPIDGRRVVGDAGARCEVGDMCERRRSRRPLGDRERQHGNCHQLRVRQVQQQLVGNGAADPRSHVVPDTRGIAVITTAGDVVEIGRGHAVQIGQRLRRAVHGRLALRLADLVGNCDQGAPAGRGYARAADIRPPPNTVRVVDPHAGRRVSIERHIRRLAPARLLHPGLVSRFTLDIALTAATVTPGSFVVIAVVAIQIEARPSHGHDVRRIRRITARRAVVTGRRQERHARLAGRRREYRVQRRLAGVASDAETHGNRGHRRKTDVREIGVEYRRHTCRGRDRRLDHVPVVGRAGFDQDDVGTRGKGMGPFDIEGFFDRPSRVRRRQVGRCRVAVLVDLEEHRRGSEAVLLVEHAQIAGREGRGVG